MEITTLIHLFSLAGPFCKSLALSEVGILKKDYEFNMVTNLT